ncbi:MAG TPA: hypothetical protein V6D37_10465 [Candidatus Sericytochromatia bacterium]
MTNDIKSVKQEQPPLTDKVGKIVVNSDEWTLANKGFANAPDTGTFVTNIAKWFTGGRSTGKFHAYSTNFGVKESSLAQTMTKAGYTWTVGTNIKFDLQTLLTFDGIFVGGDAADNQVLINYVKAGGNVYVFAGTGVGGAQPEADRWNTFLNAFGLKLAGVYNGIAGNQTVNSSHPIFAGVKAIYQANGNSIVDLDPASGTNQLILTHANGQGLIAAFEGTQKPKTDAPTKVGKIVVNADEVTLANRGFTNAPDTGTFVTNIAKWFTGGRSTGKFHAYSTTYIFNESSLAETMTKAGYTWTVGTNIPFDLPTLLTYDGIFVGGEWAYNPVLIDYVKAGGNVYLCAGTGWLGPQGDGDLWNTFLNAFGLKFAATQNGIVGNQTVNSSHPLFAGVKEIYQDNGTSIVDLDPASGTNQIILTHPNGQGLIATFEGTQKPNTDAPKKVGKIVVNADEWTLSNSGFTKAPDTGTFVTNIAKWFTGGRSTGKFHAYSTNFGLKESSLTQTMTKAGYTWTVGTTIKFDLPTLLTFDGIFVTADLAADNQVLINYVKAGGNVYLCAGTGAGGAQQEADRWNTFLNAFGLKFAGAYNGIVGNQTVNSSHPLFAGVKAIYQASGNSIVDLDPASGTNQIILTHANGQGLIAAFAGN